MTKKKVPEGVVQEIQRKTGRKYSSEEKIRIVLEGLRGEESIAELGRREGISPNVYYNWNDDYSRYIISWMLTTGMAAQDVKDTLEEALKRTGVIDALLHHRPRLLSDNGSAYISKELGDYLAERETAHTRDRPYHPMTQGKIERYHRTLKNVVTLQKYYAPWELEREFERFVHRYTEEHYHESLGNLTPADVYHGRAREVVRRERSVSSVKNNTRCPASTALATRAIARWVFPTPGGPPAQ
jgi:transposase-like protein